MPTKCPHRGSCGTLIPGWLVGDHPSVKEGEVGRAICFSRNMFQCCFDSTVVPFTSTIWHQRGVRTVTVLHMTKHYKTVNVATFFPV